MKKLYVLLITILLFVLSLFIIPRITNDENLQLKQKININIKDFVTIYFESEEKRNKEKDESIDPLIEDCID